MLTFLIITFGFISACTVVTFPLWWDSLFVRKPCFDNFTQENLGVTTLFNKKGQTVLVSLEYKAPCRKAVNKKFYVLYAGKTYGEMIMYDVDTGKEYTWNGYPDLIREIDNHITQIDAVKAIQKNIENHYSKVLSDIDNELNIKFENLEKEKAQAAQIKARIAELPKEEEEHSVPAVVATGKKKASRK